MKRRELVKQLNRVYACGLLSEHAESIIVNIIRPKVKLDGEITSLSVLGFDEATNGYKCFTLISPNEVVDDGTMLDRLNSIEEGFSWYDTLISYDRKLNVYFGRNKEILYNASELLCKLNDIKYNYRLNGPAIKLVDELIFSLSHSSSDYVNSIDIIIVPNGKDSGAGAVIPFKEPTQKLPDDKELVVKLSSWFPPVLEKLQASDLNIYPRLVYDSSEDEPIEIYVKK